MAYTTTTLLILLVSFLVLQAWTAKSDLNLAPILSPIFDNVCKEVECGKGNCKPSRNSSFLFDCECEPGWKQVRSDHDDGLGFLPCVIPNCTMDLSCMKAPTPAPVQNKQKRTNESFFDPCSWAECGGGTCNKTSPFTYACQCEANYYNLLNVTALPCFRECALGTECSDLGISVLNRSSSSQTPSLSNNDSNQACLVKGGVFNWLAFIVILLALVIEK